ncbi:MAG: M28 family peptidase, partial [Candidatus Hydrogenedentes bacterium]|nr:M28 family peptidase [Candidatus Hydrogenedentota bacterium]
AMLARDRGAVGIVFISGPNSQVQDPLVDLRFDASFSGTSIAAVSVDDATGEGLLSTAGRTLESLQTELDTGEPVMGFEPPDTRLQVNVKIVQEKRTGRNVIGRLRSGVQDSESVVVVGAHIDHLGRGAGAGSLARDYEKERIHYGADDNASGVAGLFEIAQLLAQRKAGGQLPAKRDILFAAWSGEELGLLGSAQFVKTYQGIPESAPLWPAIAAYVNMDMIGRLTSAVVLGGAGSSPVWPEAIEVWANTVDGFQFTTQNDNYLPTDATSFYVRGVPFLNAFTGAHAEYHTPRDTPEKINYEGAARIAQFMAAAVEDLACRAEAPAYTPAPKPRDTSSGAGLRAYLGTIPDYSQDDGKGVKLAGVAEGGPAATAGLRGGDVVVEFAGKKIENIYDYTYALEAVKIGEPVDIVVRRGDEQLTMKVTPGARE